MTEHHQTEMPSDRADYSGALRRWAWVIALQTVVLLLLMFDLVPRLRGFAPWPPEWQWMHLRGGNLLALVPMALAGAGIVWSGWRIDGAGTRRGRWLAVVALVAAAITWQVCAVWVRDRDLGRALAQRTTVPFLEDYFEAARHIRSPVEAFTRYEFLAGREGQLRVATHPPGLIFVYTLLQQMSPPAGGAEFSRAFFGGEHHASQLEDREIAALLWATMLKLLGGVMALGGVWLMVRAMQAGAMELPAGRILALFALVPAASLFTVSIDQLSMGLSALAIGCILCSVRSPNYPAWAAAGGLALFLQSALAFQAITTLVLAVVAALILARVWQRPRPVADQQLVICLLVPVVVPVMLWMMIGTATEYHYLARMWEGLAAHSEGPIHANRSRLAWLLWNPWDILFFLGLAWAAVWIRRGMWCPIARNPLIYAVLAVWAAVILGDAVRGETARIMLFLFPVITVALAVGGRDLLHRREDHLVLAVLLAVQTMVFAAVLNLY